MTGSENWLQTATREACFSEAACNLAREIGFKCGDREVAEFWRLIREAQNSPAPTANH